MTFDPTKPVQTRDGRKARIICTDANTNSNHPIVALVAERDGSEYAQYYTKDGYYLSVVGLSINDLINIPEQIIRWSNVYEESMLGHFSSRQSADKCATEHRIGIMKLIYEGGKLVDHEYEKLK